MESREKERLKGRKERGKMHDIDYYKEFQHEIPLLAIAGIPFTFGQVIWNGKTVPALKLTGRGIIYFSNYGGMIYHVRDKRFLSAFCRAFLANSHKDLLEALRADVDADLESLVIYA